MIGQQVLISAERIDFSPDGRICAACIPPQTGDAAVDPTNQIAYSLARSRIRAFVSELLRPVAGAGQG